MSKGWQNVRPQHLVDVESSGYSVAPASADRFEDNCPSFLLISTPPHTMMLCFSHVSLTTTQTSTWRSLLSSPKPSSVICHKNAVSILVREDCCPLYWRYRQHLSLSMTISYDEPPGQTSTRQITAGGELFLWWVPRLCQAVSFTFHNQSYKCCQCSRRSWYAIVTLCRPLRGWSSALFVALYRSLSCLFSRILQFLSLVVMIRGRWAASDVLLSLILCQPWHSIAAIGNWMTSFIPNESTFCTWTMLFVKRHSLTLRCSRKVSEFEPHMQSLCFQKKMML